LTWQDYKDQQEQRKNQRTDDDSDLPGLRPHHHTPHHAAKKTIAPGHNEVGKQGHTIII
jgi:hypothetical protein